MWPFLLILAIVPLIFFWSDNVREVFPALSDWLPEQVDDKVLLIETEGIHDFSASSSLNEPGKWYISQSEEGLVAWTVSSKGAYRLTVGCEPEAQSVLSVSHESGRTLSDDLMLNYEYGHFPLAEGIFYGTELIGGVSQFNSVSLQRLSDGELIASFAVPALSSEEIARELRAHCLS